ncbi:MAG: hypothetical protein ACOZE5_00385 [Verrucomicrobiota bacterium]
MRRLLPALGCFTLAAALCAEPAGIVVYTVPETIRENHGRLPRREPFFQALRSFTEGGEILALRAPPEWGRTVPGAAGSVRLHPPVAEGLILHVALTGLRPDHRYILTLNGRPDLPGNDLLPSQVPGLPEERYVDFHTITTGADGAFAAAFGLVLRPGEYRVRFYVKDTDDFKIVLYHDYFPCAVR